MTPRKTLNLNLALTYALMSKGVDFASARRQVDSGEGFARNVPRDPSGGANAAFSESAARSMSDYLNPGENITNAASRCLANMRHLFDRIGLDFQEIAALSQEQYLIEVERRLPRDFFLVQLRERWGRDIPNAPTHALILLDSSLMQSIRESLVRGNFSLQFNLMPKGTLTYLAPSESDSVAQSFVHPDFDSVYGVGVNGDVGMCSLPSGLTVFPDDAITASAFRCVRVGADRKSSIECRFDGRDIVSADFHVSDFMQIESLSPAEPDRPRSSL